MFDSNFILNDILFQYGGSTRRKGKEGGHPWTSYWIWTGEDSRQTPHHSSNVMDLYPADILSDGWSLSSKSFIS